MKRVLSLFLSIIMIVCSVMCVDLSVYAEEIIDIDVYKAQCISGIAEDPNTDAVMQCNAIYNYYINEEIYSPSQSFLDACYQDQDLMNKYNAFMAYNTISDPGSFLNMPKEKEDYYKTIIISSLRQTLTNEDYGLEKFIKDKTLENSVSVLDNLCNDFNVATIADLAEKFDLNSSADIELFTQTFGKHTKAYYGSDIATTATGAIGNVIGYSKDIIDLSDRISSYVSMLDLDAQSNLWLKQMLASCDSDTDPLLITALKSLVNYGTGFADAFLETINEAGYTVMNWSVNGAIDVGFATLAGSNPVLLAAVAGLKAGKALSNLFFAGDSVASQLFTMQCIYNVEDLARNVTEACKNSFISSQTSENAGVFNYAVDQYFEILTNVDTDCMEAFLDTLYNGGILSGAINWAYGVTNDYQDCIDALEGLRSARKDNYNYMICYYKTALEYYYPDTFKLYYPSEVQIDIEGIGFEICKIKPPGYPLDDGADFYEGEFCNAGVYFTPSNTTQRNYKLTSSNTDVLEIKDNCMFSAKSAGISTVTITSIDNPRISYTEDVVVGKQIDGVEDSGVTTGLKYTVDQTSKTVTITGLVDGYAPKSLKIPSKISGYPVTSIGNGAFFGYGDLINVTIPDSVTTIGAIAFGACYNLTSIIIPKNVTTIGAMTFTSCLSLKEIYVAIDNLKYCSIDGNLFNKDKTELIQYAIGKTAETYAIPSSVTTIGIGAFAGSANNLKDIVISSSVTKIGTGAFVMCYLEKVVIPSNVLEIETGALSNGCRNIVVDENNKNYKSKDGVLFNKDMTEIIQYPFKFEIEDAVSYEIPYGVETIKEFAFSGLAYGSSDMGLLSITIPKTVTTIEDNAVDISSIKDIYYRGTESQWNEIFVGNGNDSINNSNLHFHEQHIYDNSVVTINPTCTQAGVKTFTCTTCGESYTEPISATGHNFGNNNPACLVCGIGNPYYVAPTQPAPPTTEVPTTPPTTQTPQTSVPKTTAKPPVSGAKKVGSEWIAKKQKNTAIKKLSKGKKSFKISWKKITSVSGYQIQFSTDKKFKKNKKTVTISKNKTTSATVKKLKGNKKYYVRVRTYKKAKYKGKSVKVYSSWSKAKTVTTKR